MTGCALTQRGIRLRSSDQKANAAVDDRAEDSSGNSGCFKGRVLNFKKSVFSFKTFHDSVPVLWF